MTDKERHWTEAKIPQWVKESVDAEISAYRRTVALSWPNEARPEPVPFSWGDYDRIHGEPEAGVFWSVHRGIERIEIRQTGHWKGWEFKGEGYDWTRSVTRGPLFRTEREARLWHLWSKCEQFAKELAAIRAKL